MIHCEKGHENPDGALFCKECGIKVESNDLPKITYKISFRRYNWIAQIPLLLFAMAALALILQIVFYDEGFLIWLLIAVILFIVAFPVFIVLAFKYYRFWKQFDLPVGFTEAKSIIERIVFSEFQKTAKERFRLKEFSKGELKVYELASKNKFHLISDSSTTSKLIGKRDESMSFIRNTFCKDYFFIEK